MKINKEKAKRVFNEYVEKYKSKCSYLESNFRDWVINNFAWMYLRVPVWSRHFLIAYFMFKHKDKARDIFKALGMEIFIYKVLGLPLIMRIIKENKQSLYFMGLLPLLEIKNKTIIKE